jgi:hypothetical protein
MNNSNNDDDYEGGQMNSAASRKNNNNNNDYDGGQMNSAASRKNNNNNNNNYNGGQMNNSTNTTRKNNKNSMMGGARIPAKGTKAQVWHGTARHTSGGLTKKDLMKTKKGRIVSRKKHAAGKKALKNLVKAGYKAKKGTFKLFKK